MKANQLFNKKDFLLESINGKPVYIFEDHATAIIPWLMIKKEIGSVPHLITLDHHTDTMKAFNHYYGNLNNKARGSKKESYQASLIISNLLADLKELAEIYNYEEIEPLLKYLRNDEHIDLSIKLGILSYSMTLPSSSEISSPTKSDQIKQYFQKIREYNLEIEKICRSGCLEDVKFLTKPKYLDEEDLNFVKTYSMPEDKIFIIKPNIKCDGLSSKEEDSCRHKYNSNVIDDSFLYNQIGLASSMTITAIGKVVTEKPYILDIDLDYFHNTKSIIPQNCKCFYTLIRNAEAITIAKESSCVQMCKEEIENEIFFNSNYLLRELKNHIHKATISNKDD